MRRALSTALVGLLVLPLAACGGGSSGIEDVAKAATKTSNGSYAVDLTTSMELPNVSKPVSIVASGVFDTQTKRGRMALDLRELGQVSGQQLGSALMLLDGQDVYMRLPFLRRVNPLLKPWLKINLARVSRAQGVDLSSFLQLGQGGDPTQSLEYLRGAGDVKKLGGAEIRGVKTTHYRATIDFERVPDEAPAKARPQLRRSIRRMVQITGQRKLPTEVWIDSRGRARKMTYRQRFTLGGQRLNSTVTLEIYDFGTKVDVVPPPASQVTDLTKLTTPGQGG